MWPCICQTLAPSLLCHLCCWRGYFLLVMKRNDPLSPQTHSYSPSLSLSSFCLSFNPHFFKACTGYCQQAHPHIHTNPVATDSSPSIALLWTHLNCISLELASLAIDFFFFYSLFRASKPVAI